MSIFDTPELAALRDERDKVLDELHRMHAETDRVGNRLAELNDQITDLRQRTDAERRASGSRTKEK